MDCFDVTWSGFDPYGYLQEIQNDLRFSSEIADVFNTSYPVEEAYIHDDCGFVDLLAEDNEKNTQHTPSHHVLEYKVDWCLKTGKERRQQFWCYCEESQNNFAKFTLSAPGMKLSPTSNVMKQRDGSLVIVEDTQLPTVKAMLVDGNNEIFTISKVELSPVCQSDFSFDIELVQDEQEPFHPLQGPADIVNCTVQQIKRNYRGKIPSPLGFMFQINFTARSEGWFKLKCIIRYQNKVIVRAYSNTFMLNNPRMKKMKEHQFFKQEELKFMQIYSLCKDAENIPATYWTRICNERNMNVNLIAKAAAMFPVKKKKASNPKKRKMSDFPLPTAKVAKL